MSIVVTTLRRSLWLLLIGAVGGVAWSWWSDRNAPPSPTTPPEWPPLEPEASSPSSSPSSPPVVSDWVVALDDGTCPPTHPIKANANSGIFHVPGGRSYERTQPDRCYPTTAAAIADGYRQAKI